MYIVVLPTLVSGRWLYVECGSSASGRRLRLRREVHLLNLPQVLNLREVIQVLSPEVQLQAGQRKANPPERPHNLEENLVIYDSER